MMATWSLDFGFEQLKKHQDLIASSINCNEATTRLRAIDTILFDVLGWDKACVDAEKYVKDVGVADYAFLQNKSLCLILEAKKEGKTFILPERSYGDRPVGFALIAHECPEAEKAMVQASGYAASEGARFVAITNGYQWILSLSFVANQPISERSVFVFESVQVIKDRFKHFWDCFSPEAIFSNRPGAELLESRKAPAPAKFATSIPNYPTPANRNVIANELGYVIGIVWNELSQHESDEDFLRSCYVPRSRSQC